MINIKKTENDDYDFIIQLQILSNEIINNFKTNEVYLFRVDNWFDKKWINFTGKVLGAVGTWNYQNELRIPPFTPNRIEEQLFYRKDINGKFIETEIEIEIHKLQPAEKNQQRRISQVSDSAIFIWYSSNTIKNDNGSLMIYCVENGKCASYYIGFNKNENWKISESINLHKKDLIHYLEKSKNAI